MEIIALLSCIYFVLYMFVVNGLHGLVQMS